MIFSSTEINQITQIVRHAGDLILKVYHTDFEVDIKDDKSPLTIADQQANDYLVKMLSELFPHIHFITEETKDAPFEERKDWEYTWIIDPLDGTKEFVKKNDEFTVNVALCHKSEIIFGIILIPVTGEIFYAQKNQGSYKIENGNKSVKLACVKPDTELIAVASRSHRSQAVDDYVNQLSKDFEKVNYLAAGSSLKLCRIAEGKAHIYPRLGPTMEWDTAAGHIIALEAGAKITRHDNGQPLKYNKENLRNPFFIVSTL